MAVRETGEQIRTAFKHNWKSFLGIHVAANIFSVVVLTPLATLLMGMLILASGQTALKDEDILFFALTPTGSVILLLIAAAYTTMVIFEIAAMIVAAYRLESGKKVGPAGIIREMLSIVWPLFRLALQMIGRTAMTAAPFVAVSALVFFSFVNEFDINYYLTHRPVEFWWATALITLCLLFMSGVLLRMFSGWFLALPLLLLKGETPFNALRTSRASVAPLHRPITMAMLTLIMLNLGLFAMVSLLVDVGMDGAVTVAGNSLQLLAYLLGAVLIIWFLASFTITLIGNSILCLLILHIFNRMFDGEGIRRTADKTASTIPARTLHVSAFGGAAIMVILVVAAGLAINVMMDRFDLEDHSKIIAHRGASAGAPENTLAAMELAISEGAEWIEVDVQETSQGEVVVIHDKDLKRIGGSDLSVFETPLAKLQSVDIGSWMDPSFGDQRIPTLQQLLATCKDRINVIIELKYYGREEQLEDRVVKIVEAAGMQGQVAVMSLSYQGTQKLKSIRPDWKVGLLSSVAIGDITRLNVDFFAINANFASRTFVRLAQKRGREVLVWTVNDPVSMSAMMSKGVNGIITDKPGLAYRTRTERAGLDIHERMIIQLASFIGQKPSRHTQ
jgi:glycerophosphoryl diester phosphodiesterase